ncbi:MAG: DUF2975 domain-containing protein [Rhodoferax sp.]|uniref:DUF2975 domain-containing protein n=1 Tax=Rhodoferax sp. TaxID=50421 RepID=UPI00260E4598|nr:DUF2975 domain-containing protein [Rhodoferax sp.]MDD5333677.1 DUF2975 domain-containing protein [Rhodoferax sp.]
MQLSSPVSLPPADHLQRIRRLGCGMAWTCMALIALLPCVLVAYWATTSAPELAAQGNLNIQLPLQPWQRLAGAAVTSVPLILLLTGLWHARQCFDQFAKGQVFTAQATARLRRFAGWVAAAALAGIVAGAATSVLLTLHNPPGTRQLSVSINSNHLFTLFFAAVVWLMAAVIGQGQALAEENEHFV